MSRKMLSSVWLMKHFASGWYGGGAFHATTASSELELMARCRRGSAAGQGQVVNRLRLDRPRLPRMAYDTGADDS